MGKNGVLRGAPPPPPDEQRCSRTDGKGWQCKGLKCQDQRFCEKHHDLEKKKKKKKNVKGKLKEQIPGDEKGEGLLRNGKNRKGVDCVLDSSEEEDEEEQRCTRNNGNGWRCKGLKFQGHNYCEKHYNDDKLKKNNMRKVEGKLKEQLDRDGNGKKRKGEEEEEEVDEDKDDDDEEEVKEQEMKKRRVDCNGEDKGFQKKYMRRRLGHGFSGSSEEQVEEIQAQPTIIMRNYTGVFSMKRNEECSISELILSLKTSFRDIDFEEVASILKSREENVKMEKEVAEKNAARFKEELETYEVSCNKMLNEVEERKMKEVNEVQDKIGELELKRVAIEEELHRYKRMYTELKTKNIDLENEKRRAENEIGLWKKRFQAIETKGFQTDVSCTKEGKRNVTRQMGIEGRTDCPLDGSCLSNIKNKEAALDFNAKVYASASVDLNCHPSAKESGIGQHAGAGVKYGSVAREKMECQPKGNSYKTLTSLNVEHGSITREQMASQPDGSSYICSATVCILRPASEGITKTNNGGACEDSQVQINKFKVSSVEGLASGLNHHPVSSVSKSCEIRNVLTKPEISKDSLTCPYQKSILPQKLTGKRNGAIRTPSDHLVVRVETDNVKEVKSFGSDHGDGFNGSSANANPEHVEDGISKFLRELGRLKGGKSNWKGSPVVVD